MSVLDRVNSVSPRAGITSSVTRALPGSGFRPPMKGSAKPAYQAVQQTSQQDRTAKVAGYGDRLMHTARVKKTNAKTPRLVGESMGFAHSTQGKGGGHASTSPLECFRILDTDSDAIKQNKQTRAKTYAKLDAHLTYLITCKGSKRDIAQTMKLMVDTVQDRDIDPARFAFRPATKPVPRPVPVAINVIRHDVESLKLERASLLADHAPVFRGTNAGTLNTKELAGNEAQALISYRAKAARIACIDAMLLAPVQTTVTREKRVTAKRSAKPSKATKVDKLNALAAIVASL